jgi:hypothetical protein
MYKRAIIAVAGLALGAAALLAQTATTGAGGGFQQAGTLIGPASVTPSAIPSRIVTGSPFSAVEERRTVQTLGDGTMLESSESNTVYRDSDGRIRTERTVQGHTTITIMDPVARTMVRLDPTAKTARKSMMAGGAIAAELDVVGRGRGSRGTLAATVGNAEYQAGYAAAGVPAGLRGAAPATTITTSSELRAKAALDEQAKVLAELNSMRATTTTQSTTEDLGMMHQNGIPAQGTRTTLTIPVGQIGNNREIKVVNERWYSQDLQMMVKSVNSDPRFGTTTYELKNIVRANPDSILFQIPPDYTVQESGAPLMLQLQPVLRGK